MENTKKREENKVKKQVIITLSVIAAILVICIALGVILGALANAVKEPILEYKGVKLPLSFYELMLSITKGDLERSGEKITYDSFWDADSPKDGETNEEYYNSLVLDNCKRYLAALYMFEDMGLTLPQSYLDEIDEEYMEFYLSYDAENSPEKFNEILEPFGADVDSLREAYIIRAKIEYLQIYLYGADGSLISDSAREEYYRDNYYRYKQIFVSAYYYEYQKDEYGREIYFDAKVNGKPIYDTENGTRDFDENRNFKKDGYGTEIYFGEDGKPLYDTEKGYKCAVLDGDGNAKRFYYTEDEMADRATFAEQVYSELSEGNIPAFEAMVEDDDYNDDYLVSSYPDGYYVSDLEKSRYADYENKYMTDALDMLKDMEIGDISKLDSEDGYHIIMKYELDSGAYNKENYESGFADFITLLASQLFVDRCDRIIPDIEENAENLGKAKSIKEIGSNLYYGYFYS